VKRQDILSILITFVFGFLLGGYFYLTNVAGFVSEIKTPDKEAVSTFIIQAEAYGGCRQTCPSFQVQDDGLYYYLYTPAAGAEKVVRKGSIPGELEKALHRVVTIEELQRQSTDIEPAVCNSYTDGIDVVYEITLDGIEYNLDSCGTAVEGESILWTTLQSIWSYFETGEK
jgi:hypothetical protein